MLAETVRLPVEVLPRHKHGDWGDLEPGDRRENERTLRAGSQLLSAHATNCSERPWVISEWDGSLSTLLRSES